MSRIIWRISDSTDVTLAATNGRLIVSFTWNRSIAVITIHITGEKGMSIELAFIPSNKESFPDISGLKITAIMMVKISFQVSQNGGLFQFLLHNPHLIHKISFQVSQKGGLFQFLFLNSHLIHKMPLMMLFIYNKPIGV